MKAIYGLAICALFLGVVVGFGWPVLRYALPPRVFVFPKEVQVETADDVLYYAEKVVSALGNPERITVRVNAPRLDPEYGAYAEMYFSKDGRYCWSGNLIEEEEEIVVRIVHPK